MDDINYNNDVNRDKNEDDQENNHLHPDDYLEPNKDSLKISKQSNNSAHCIDSECSTGNMPDFDNTNNLSNYSDKMSKETHLVNNQSSDYSLLADELENCSLGNNTSNQSNDSTKFAIDKYLDKKSDKDYNEESNSEQKLDQTQINNNNQTLGVSTSSKDENKKTTIKRKRSLSDFRIGKVIGKGSYSKVFHAREKTTGIDFAIKSIKKHLVRREKKTHMVIREKLILTMINNPFFVKMFFAFQDEKKLYYGLSLAKGGDLLDYLKECGSFQVETIKYFASEIFSAVDYLHSIDVIHRDLKPENILLSDKLHILITDFGTAICLSKDIRENNDPDKSWRSKSFVGTAQYVSPELLLLKYTVKSSDLWSIGCIVYQMAVNRFPFTGSNDYHTFQSIIANKYAIPNNLEPNVVDLISKLLVTDYKKRLGCIEMGGFSSIKSHPFFIDVDWDNLINHKPPKEIQDVYSEKFESKNYEEFTDNEPDFLMHQQAVLHDANNFIKNSDLVSTTSISDKNKIIKKQIRENIWNKFVDGKLIIKQGFIYKKKGLFPRRRMFLLTEGPSIYYVDPILMELKGTIPFDKNLTTSAKNFNNFYIHTPNRTYILEDKTGNANSWIDEINIVKSRYFPE